MTRRELEFLIHRKLLTLGWRVQRATPAPQGWESARAYWDPAYLRRLGFRPGTIIDVGVARGTPDLYDAFPKAYLLLAEPVAEFSAEIAGILAQRPGVHFPVAVGAEPGTRELHVEPRQPLLTSFYQRHVLERTGDTSTDRIVPVETLDNLVARTACPRPFGLKIDTEGAEMEVIRGASETLRETEFVIAEVSVLPRFEGSYGFAGFIAAMDARGFEACDFLDIGRASTSLVTFIDIVFRRKGSGQ